MDAICAACKGYKYSVCCITLVCVNVSPQYYLTVGNDMLIVAQQRMKAREGIN